MEDNELFFLSVVTRTRNRKITLERLMRNLTKQSFKAFEWVIVNDGGDKDEVEETAKLAIQYNLSVKVINNELSQGRSAAANVGVKNACGKYVLILDDDDYTHPDYFQKNHDFFNTSSVYGAATCWSQIVNEEINNGEIIQHGLGGLYAPNENNVSILNLHTYNIPTCGFIIERAMFLKVNGYPEGIDCTEDWAFVCNVVIETNIGVIPEVLAYISKRIAPTGFYKNTNSDLAGMDTHLKHEVLWKNDRVRETLKMEHFSGLAVLFGSINLSLNEINQTVNRSNLQISRGVLSGITQLFVGDSKDTFSELRSLKCSTNSEQLQYSFDLSKLDVFNVVRFDPLEECCQIEYLGAYFMDVNGVQHSATLNSSNFSYQVGSTFTFYDADPSMIFNVPSSQSERLTTFIFVGQIKSLDKKDLVADILDKSHTINRYEKSFIFRVLRKLGLLKLL